MSRPHTALFVPSRPWLAMLLFLSLACSTTGSLFAQSSVIAVDLYNKKIHIQAGQDIKRPVGGVTMIATALVALDWSEATKNSLSTLVSVPPQAFPIAGDNPLNLYPGDQITLRDLLFATMMASDNVSATALAGFVGSDILMRRGKTGDPIEEFVSQMNKLAAREGAKNTKFTNPHGLENSRSVPYSTAADMARITLYALSRAPFRFYTNQRTRDIRVIRGGQGINIPLHNTNQLLGVGTIDGVKTGNTPRSGGCLVISEEHSGTVMKQADGKDAVFRHRMIVVVLGSPDPFSEGKSLLNQGWNIYDQWIRGGRPVTDASQLLR